MPLDKAARQLISDPLLTEALIRLAFSPTGQTLAVLDPLEVAYTWWHALQDVPRFLTVLDRLSFNPSDWHGYHQAAEMLAHVVLEEDIEVTGKHYDTVHIRFTPAASNSQDNNSPPRGKSYLMTLIQPENSHEWLVRQLTLESSVASPEKV